MTGLAKSTQVATVPALTGQTFRCDDRMKNVYELY